MLEDVAKIRRVVLATGYVDLRKGIDGLAQIIGANYGQNRKREPSSCSAAGARTAPRGFMDEQRFPPIV